MVSKKYVTLFRGINVGGNRKVEMKRLKLFFESLEYENVSTYINSGNVIFTTDKKYADLKKEIKKGLGDVFGFDIDMVVKTDDEIMKIASVIPESWKNDKTERTDVVYLFDEIDHPDISDQLPIKKEFVNIIYTKGALIWNFKRENFNKSGLNKIIGTEYYKNMTIRNVNTARYLAGLMSQNK